MSFFGTSFVILIESNFRATYFKDPQSFSYSANF